MNGVISTYQALAVALIALLPGASYTFAVERSLGSYGVKFSDRLVRFLAASAIFHALAAGPEYLLYLHYFAGNTVSQGHVRWWDIEIVALIYVFLPIGVGTLLAHLRSSALAAKPADQQAKWIARWWRSARWAVAQAGRAVARWSIGEQLEPRAWDWMWNHDVRAIVRIKLKSGTWLAGFWGQFESGANRNRRAYASGYPEDGDLYLSVGLQIDSTTGELVRDSNKPVPTPGERGLLVRWDEVEYIDFQEF